MTMQAINLNEIAEKNSQVDPDQVKDALQTVAELRKHGVRRAHYSLVGPYDRATTTVKRTAEDVRIPRIRSTR
jgi:hypothetical protein